MGFGLQKSFLKRRGDVRLGRIDGRSGGIEGRRRPSNVLGVLGVRRCIWDMKRHLDSSVRG